MNDNNELKHVITVIMGDWSGDGHNMQKTIVIKSNMTQDEVQQAYEIGAKKLGYSISELCEEYEDNEIPVSLVTAIKDAGITLKNCYDYLNDTGDMCQIYQEHFFEIFMATVKLGCPTFEYTINAGIEKLVIGGYGLFAT